MMFTNVNNSFLTINAVSLWILCKTLSLLWKKNVVYTMKKVSLAWMMTLGIISEICLLSISKTISSIWNGNCFSKTIKNDHNSAGTLLPQHRYMIHLQCGQCALRHPWCYDYYKIRRRNAESIKSIWYLYKS